MVTKQLLYSSSFFWYRGKSFIIRSKRDTPADSKNTQTSRADFVFRTMYVQLSTNYTFINRTLCILSMSVLTHAEFYRKWGSENGSELLGVSSQNHLTRLCTQQPFGPEITKSNQQIKQVHYNYRNNCLFSLPASGTKHSVSTACPASSTNM